MPLPRDPRTPWPPKAVKGELADITEAAAWYSSDQSALRGNQGGGQTSGQQGQNQRQGARGRFWQRRGSDQAPNRQQYHVPLAADMASVSADLVVGDEPELRIPELDSKEARTGTQERLDTLGHEGGLHNGLLEALEVCAALGGVYLRVAWDEDVAGHPLLTAVHPDAAVPEWRFGMLRAVTFWSTLHIEADGKKRGQVWRHLERHEPGVVQHGLFVGDRDRLGEPQPLAAHPDTESLDDETNDDGYVELPAELDQDLMVGYVPNVLPNRKRRRSMQGRPDVQGSFDLLDALDEAYTSWMRDLRLGQARIVAAEQALQRGSGRGGGTFFDPDREVYAGLDVDPTEGNLLEPVQFAIRYEAHERTIVNLVERIVSAAGYAPQTFGLNIQGRAEAGTALRVREARTLRTRGRKQGYATKPVAERLRVMLAVDSAVFGSRVEPVRPSVSWGEALVDDPRETAETVRMLKDAKAASVEARVRMAQPDLEGDALEAEVERVKAEEGIGALADPEGGPA